MKDSSIIRISFIGILMALLLVACQSKPRGYVNGFERFVERVEKNASSYTNEQWEKNDEQLKKYVDQYDKEKQKLSSDEKRKVGELTVRYYKARVKAKGLNILGEIDGWLEYLKGFSDEIMKDVENYQNQ
jgi:hypothetical protein